MFEEMTRVLKILLHGSDMPGLLKILMIVHCTRSRDNNRVLRNRKTLEAGRYFLGMHAGLGTRNIAHGPEITTVCYEKEKPSRRADIFDAGGIVNKKHRTRSGDRNHGL